LAAAAAGVASIVGVDRSAEALSQARRHFELNGFAVPADYIRGDVPRLLREFRQEGRMFDLIVLDPPRMVQTAAQKEKGLRGYKDINRLAMELLAPGGILASFSCSGLVSVEEFRMMVGWASVDSRRNVRILETLGQPPDHPSLAVFRESEYLKGVIAQVE
jgi:23S rRNA (cytosine1962-C5)-methyltransferase